MGAQKIGIRLSCFAAALLLLLFSFAGCSGNRAVDSITAIALFSKEKLTLPIRADNASVGGLEGNGYLTFETELTLDELYDIISKIPEISASKYERAIWIKKISGGGYTDYYCLAKHENQYVFSGMRGILITDIDKSGNQVKSALLLPVHLITDPLILEGATPYYTLYIDVEYKRAAALTSMHGFIGNAAGMKRKRMKTKSSCPATEIKKASSFSRLSTIPAQTAPWRSIPFIEYGFVKRTASVIFPSL